MRVAELSTGRLVELLTEAALDSCLMPEVVVVPPTLLAEAARRVTAGRRPRR